MAETDTLSYNGVGFIESQERVDEYKSGVPAKGAAAILFTAPIKRTSKIAANNTGKESCVLRAMHQGMLKTASLEYLTAFAAGTTYTGKFQFGRITPGSISITNAGAPLTIVDDSAGRLYDTGFVGVAANLRGTVNYMTGAFTFTYGAAPTQPVRVTYTHTDASDFASANNIVVDAGGALPHTINSPFGRVVPRSVSLTDGVATWIDDGHGFILETVPAIAKVGSIDYATGVIVITAGPVPGALTAASVMKYNPFAALLAAGGSAKLLDLFSQIPELTNAPYAAGIKSETALALVGEGATANGQGTNVHTMWSHYSEEPYRVQAVFAGFGPGGHDNDPTLDQSVNHL
jgi:hypothetical protein